VAAGLILAAPASGCGKTVLTLALLRHLRRMGFRVASAKAGPDYLDPEFHAAASGAPCVSLDAWAMRPATLRALAGLAAAGADLLICEGAMGLFDGAGLDAAGSTADLARITEWPVALVIDASGQGASVAALAAGFAGHRAEVPLAGLILNRVGSARHEAMLARALGRTLPGLPILGMVPRHEALQLPSRHLGLVQAAEHQALDAFLDRAASIVGAAIDVERLVALASRGQAPEGDAPVTVPPLGQRIAVARDTAFAFAYPTTLAGWRAAGATVSFFSPLADQAPEATADAVYLPGGYPELHAGALAGNRRFLLGLSQAAARGAAVYGECGGYMVLGRGLVDAAGARHAMAALLPLETSFAERRRHLGYRIARLVDDGPLGKADAIFQAHEFHYATIVSEGPGRALFEAADADGAALGPAGLREGVVAGSFLHLIDRQESLEKRP
jgi:cobyrinic acid a,c-diamide synthase